MKNEDFLRALACATGESVGFLKNMGFSPMNLPTKDYRPAKNCRRHYRHRPKPAA